MKIMDISQEVFSCAVYPGDPSPQKRTVCSTGAGDLYNLTSFAMCAHNGTHVDAPFHFLHDGKTVDRMDLGIFVGQCYVARHEGDVTAADAEDILNKAAGAERILIAGYPKGDPLRQDLKSFKRKSMEKITDRPDAKLEPARLAPSAVNSQPWFFTHGGDTIHIWCSKKGSRLDAGIALAHLYVTNEDSFRFFKADQAAALPGYTYIGSVTL